MTAKSVIKFDIFQIIIKVLKHTTNMVKPAGKLKKNCKWLQSESKRIEVKHALLRPGPKPVNIFKTFERVQYIPILMPPLPNQCFV